MPANYSYHLSTLNKSQQSIYETFIKKLRMYSSTIKLPFVHPNEILLVFEALLLDHPDLFYTSSYRYLRDLNKAVIINPDYHFSLNEIRQHEATILSSLSFVDAVKNKSDFEKVLHIHDFILDNIKYDRTFSGNSNTVLGVAKDRAAVCEGISKYVKLALDCLSVKSIVVLGHATNFAFSQSASEAHSWNMVEINGGWYHLDVTFDLTLKHKKNRYDYFLVKDEDIRIDHSTGTKLPMSSLQSMDYYFTKGLAVAKSFELERLINSGLLNGQRIMQFRLLNVRDGLNPSEKILQVAKEQCQLVLNRSFSVEVRYNRALWIYEIEIL